jgi:putative ATP-dependent endonuclease of OLD family
MDKPYIAHVNILNYRNFEKLSINTAEKQMIIGENAVGKSNYIRALQLILDSSLSEQDRMLTEEDFPSSHEKPMDNGEKITISIFISGYESTPALMCILADSVVVVNGDKYAKITYIFQPVDEANPSKGYTYNIFKGKDENNKFDSFCRKYFNLKVIHALRDVESELLSTRKSPLRKLIDKYKLDLSDESYKEIIEEIKNQNKKLLSIDEIADVRANLKRRIDGILIKYNSSCIDIDLAEENPNRLLSLLRIFENGHNLSETSLGICNVIYIQLILEQLQKNLPLLIPRFMYEAMDATQQALIEHYYEKTEQNNYLKNVIPISAEDNTKLNEILSLVDETRNCTTILAIEEPEAHLHPSFQRMLYKDIFVNANTPIILTSHSPHIASICPIQYIVEFRRNSNNLSVGTSAQNADLSKREKMNLQRYIDVNRGDIYFGKGVILVEGISEQTLIPVFSDKMGFELDSKGVIVCNINSTNFYPYLKLLNVLNIPRVMITDGDPDCEETGFKRIKDICVKLYDKKVIDELDTTEKWNVFFIKEGYFIGNSTLEIDEMKLFSQNSHCDQIIDSFNNATSGGEVHKNNFKARLLTQDYVGCLNMVERKEVGKGRFAQELANSNITNEDIPTYIKSAVNRICELV